MMTLRFLLVVALALCLTTCTQGFVPTKKKTSDQHAAFRNEKNSNNKNSEDELHAGTASIQMQYQPTPSSTAAFSKVIAPVYEYDEYEDDEEDVSYEVAVVSCIISLVVGFGTGYLV